MSGTHTCPTCEDEFDTDHGMKVHHVQSHGKSLAREERSCENCGEEFSVYKSKAERDRGRFCSRGCYDDFRCVDTECSWCEAEMTVERRRAEKYDRVWCSPECEAAWKSEYQVGENHHQYNQVELKCETCGDEFTRPPAHVSGQNSFCSPDCRADWMAENFVGEDHPCWTGGSPEYYGENWRQKRRKALKRDSYECRICGIGDEQHRDQLGQGLDVHHIQPIRTFDELEEANRLSNLVTLCRGCHSRWECIPIFPITGGEASA